MALEERLVSEIRERMDFHRGAIRKLETALAALSDEGEVPSAPAPRGRPASTGNDRKSTTRRGRPAGSGKPNRADQAFGIVQQTPGIEIPAIAKEMGIEPNYLYRVMPKMEAEGRVRREGHGWHASVS